MSQTATSKPPEGQSADAKPAEGLAWLSLLATLLLTEQIASKAARDALFLDAFDPRRLPAVMIGGAVFSMLTVLVTRGAHSRFAPRLVLASLLGLSAVLFAFEAVLSWTEPRVAAVVLYVHVSGFGALVVSSFWTVVSQRWDPHVAKKNVARLAAFTALGGVLGGGVALLAPFLNGGRALLPALSVSSALTAIIALRRVGEGTFTDPTDDETAPAPPMRKLVRWQYLWGLAGLAALVAIWEALLDYGFKAMADASLTDQASLVRFFGAFYMTTSLLGFVVQSTIGRVALQRGGVSATAAATPAAVVLGVLGVFGMTLPFAAALRGIEMLLSNSLLRSSYEIYFNPLPRQVVRGTKTLVDVAATRIGDILGGLLVLALVAFELDPSVAMVVASVAAVVALIVIPLISQGYVHALTALLRRGMTLGATENLDRTTRRALEHPVADRLALIALDDIVSPSEEARPTSLWPVVAALESPDPAVVRNALGGPIDPALVRVVVPLLARDDVRAAAMKALTTLAPQTTGALVDALVDRTTPPGVRARIAQLFRKGTVAGAILGLQAGLEDELLEVRLQCARGLAHLAAVDAPGIDEARILRAIAREIEREGAEWAAMSPEPHDDEEDPSTLETELRRVRLTRSLRYVLVLVSVLVDRQKLELALRGLASEDPGVRGTAFELLSNVLPETVRAPLLGGLDPDRRWSILPRLGPPEVASPT